MANKKLRLIFLSILGQGVPQGSVLGPQKSHKKHKKANMSVPRRINREARKIAKTFDVADGVDTMAK